MRYLYHILDDKGITIKGGEVTAKNENTAKIMLSKDYPHNGVNIKKIELV